MPKRDSLTAAIFVVGATVAVLVAVVAVRGVQASRTADSRPSPLSISDDLEFANLTADVRISRHEHLLSEILREIETTKRQRAETQARLAKAEVDRVALPEKIKRLSGEVSRLIPEITSAEDIAWTAERILTNFEATIPDRMKRAQAEAASTKEAEFSAGVDQVELERKKRNEIRARVGAQREDQEEAFRSRQGKRKALEIADLGFRAAIERERQEVAAETAAIARNASNARAVHSRLVKSQRAAIDLLAESEQSLADAIVLVASAPSQIASLDAELTRLAGLQATRENLLQVACREKQRRDDAIALAKSREADARAKAREAESRRVTAAPVTVASYSPQPTAVISETPSIGVRTGSASPRYFDPHNRPSVGSHHVDGYTRRDGTYVQGHMRTDADNSFWNNWSSSGNINPFTGRVGNRVPRSFSSGGSSYVKGHVRSDGSYVSGHYRRN